MGYEKFNLDLILPSILLVIKSSYIFGKKDSYLLISTITMAVKSPLGPF